MVEYFQVYVGVFCANCSSWHRQKKKVLYNCVGVTLIFQRRATSTVCVCPALGCQSCCPSWILSDPPCFCSLVSAVTSLPASWTPVTNHRCIKNTHTHTPTHAYLFFSSYEDLPWLNIVSNPFLTLGTILAARHYINPHLNTVGNGFSAVSICFICILNHSVFLWSYFLLLMAVPFLCSTQIACCSFILHTVEDNIRPPLMLTCFTVIFGLLFRRNATQWALCTGVCLNPSRRYAHCSIKTHIVTTTNHRSCQINCEWNFKGPLHWFPAIWP